MGRGVVAKFEDPRMALQRSLHDSALNATAAAVNHAHLTKPGSSGGVEVFGDDRRDIAWRETVQVELGSDWYPHWEIAHVFAASSQLPALSYQP